MLLSNLAGTRQEGNAVTVGTMAVSAKSIADQAAVTTTVINRGCQSRKAWCDDWKQTFISKQKLVWPRDASCNYINIHHSICRLTWSDSPFTPALRGYVCPAGQGRAGEYSTWVEPAAPFPSHVCLGSPAIA